MDDNFLTIRSAVGLGLGLTDILGPIETNLSRKVGRN